MAGFYGRTPRSSQASVPRRNLMTQRDSELHPIHTVADDSTPRGERVSDHGLSEIRNMISKGFKEIMGPLNKLQEKVDAIENEIDLLKQKIDENELAAQSNPASKPARLPKVLTVGRLSYGVWT